MGGREVLVENVIEDVANNIRSAGESIASSLESVSQGLRKIAEGRTPLTAQNYGTETLKAAISAGEALHTLATHYSRKTPELRDQFAQEAMRVLISQYEWTEENYEWTEGDIARPAYSVADAMIGERNIRR